MRPGLNLKTRSKRSETFLPKVERRLSRFVSGTKSSSANRMTKCRTTMFGTSNARSATISFPISTGLGVVCQSNVRLYASQVVAFGAQYSIWEFYKVWRDADCWTSLTISLLCQAAGLLAGGSPHGFIARRWLPVNCQLPLSQIAWQSSQQIRSEERRVGEEWRYRSGL